MRIVIAGGGFGGMNLAKALASTAGIEVVLIDMNNYHFFPPLLYQVATSFIEPSNISYPFRKMFQRKENIRYYNGKVTSVFPAEHIVETTTGRVEYDYLVLAMGTETNYFGMENVKKHALPMKTIDDALNLRNRLLLNLEQATRTKDKKEQELLTTIVIAGGGPTGVEVAGMLAEMGRRIKRKDYPELDDTRAKIYLVDALNTLLAPMSEKSQKEAISVLKSLNVHIILGTAVKDYVDHKVILSNGEQIPTATLVWASGVVARSVNGLPEESFTKGRRVLVDEFNRVKGVHDIFAIGDQCMQLSDKNYRNGHPQLAQVAIQQGQHLAKNFKRLRDGEEMKPFSYFNKGSMAIISKYKAVVDLPKGFFKGFFAWLTWLFVHIIPIAGFRNKLKLAYNWLWSFITNDPTLRLIIRPKSEDLAATIKPADKMEVREPEFELR